MSVVEGSTRAPAPVAAVVRPGSRRSRLGCTLAWVRSGAGTLGSTESADLDLGAEGVVADCLVSASAVGKAFCSRWTRDADFDERGDPVFGLGYWTGPEKG